MRKLIAVLSMLFAVTAPAQVPTPNGNAVTANANGNVTRFGTVPDTTTWGSPQRGVPMSAVPVEIYFDAPSASDDDYWVEPVATGTTAKTYTIVNSGLPPSEETRPDGTAVRYPRNVIVSMSGTLTTTVTIVGFDQRWQKQTETIQYEGEFGVKAGVVTWNQITSVSTGSSSSSRTMKVGFGNTFGVGYPMYHTINAGARFDTDGVGLPNSTDAATFTPGAPAQFSSLTATEKLAAQNGTQAYNFDRYGTVTFANAPDGTNDYVVVFMSSNVVGNGNGQAYK